MNRSTILICGLLLLSAVLLPGATPKGDAIDWDQARALYRREQQGEKLTAAERTYLERAKAIQRQGQPDRNEKRQRKAPERLIPITDMPSGGRYEDQDGGLYGGGKNAPSGGHLSAAREQLAQIRPLAADGRPDAGGTIGFISISMSNATQEFSRFKQIADQAPEKSPRVTIVDCAQGGQAMAEWAPADARPWQVALQRLQAAGVTPSQVQVAWVKLANKSPGGSLKEHGGRLEQDTLKVLQNAKNRFPNLRIAYLGSRIWAGNARGALNPEPYAYESGFVVRWLIQRQAGGDAELALEQAPLLLWGPYLWAEGEKGRQGDDLVWLPADFAGDGVHPSASGRDKVARLLLDFVTTDPLARSWFTGR
jgi:hypothetical protein